MLQVFHGVTVVQGTTLIGEMVNQMIITTTKIASHIRTCGSLSGMMIIVILYIHIYVKFEKVIIKPFVTILHFFYPCARKITEHDYLK